MMVLVYVPLQIILCTVFLYLILGWRYVVVSLEPDTELIAHVFSSAFVGLAVMILLFPIPGLVARKIEKVQNQRLKRTDARVQVVSEGKVAQIYAQMPYLQFCVQP